MAPNEVIQAYLVMSVTSVHKVIQEESSIFWEVIASVIVKEKIHHYVSNSEKLPR